tara:strand:- start:182 stop:331 length:150 start_codon:yes stop_codon:yes gene_type:complete
MDLRKGKNPLEREQRKGKNPLEREQRKGENPLEREQYNEGELDKEVRTT